MYKQPTTEITAFETKLMQGGISTMSPGGGEGPGATEGNDAPKRREGLFF